MGDRLLGVVVWLPFEEEEEELLLVPRLGAPSSLLALILPPFSP